MRFACTHAVVAAIVVLLVASAKAQDSPYSQRENTDANRGSNAAVNVLPITNLGHTCGRDCNYIVFAFNEPKLFSLDVQL